MVAAIRCSCVELLSVSRISRTVNGACWARCTLNDDEHSVCLLLRFCVPSYQSFDVFFAFVVRSMVCGGLVGVD